MTQPARLASRFIGAFVAACAITLSGCNNSGPAPASSQVVANVNGKELTIHQLNYVLAHSNRANREATDARSAALESLIDETLLSDRSIQEKLDRDPTVRAAAEAAQRSVYAQAYVDRLQRAASPPSEVDIRDFYLKHPELFAERRNYRFDEIAMPKNEELGEELRRRIEGAKNLDSIATLLGQRGVKFGRRLGSVRAEELPLAVAAQLHKLREGQSALVLLADTMQVMQLKSAVVQPVSEKVAAPWIERFLLAERRKAAVGAGIAQIRANSKIAYSPDATLRADRSEVVASTSAKPKSTTVAGVPAAGKEGAAGSNQPHLDRAARALR